MTKKITDCAAYKYCAKSVRLKSTPKYVKMQMRDFMAICAGKSKDYIVSGAKLKQLENILKLLKMPKGLKAGLSLYECTTGYQWLLYTAVLCVVRRDDKNKRRYETGLLEIARKNYKTFTVATIFIYLFLTEPNFSEFFSVAPDGSLSKMIFNAVAEILRSSPLVYGNEEKRRFRILYNRITMPQKGITYMPLSFSTSRLDGRMPNVYCADEVGALSSNYPIEAMRSGQLNMKNKLGFILSTKYPTAVGNPFEDEVAYSKKVLEGTAKDDTRFSLLFEPDDAKDWETNDLILKQANPAALESEEIWTDLIKKRAYAIAVDAARENFLTKHCNIIYQNSAESYIDIKDVRACKVPEGTIDWNGRVVYIGLDLSKSVDNTSVSIVALDDDNRILADSFCFFPEDRTDEKTKIEKVNYRRLAGNGKVFACGDRVIDYSFIEDFILHIEEKLGVEVQAVGYDPWNALSTIQKLENDENHPMTCVEVKPISRVLHSATKLLKEKILKGEFAYEPNQMLEINFQNARTVYDSNQNLWLDKRKQAGRIDMVASLITAIHLLEKDAILEDSGFVAQVL